MHLALIMLLQMSPAPPAPAVDPGALTAAAPAQPKRICRSVEHTGSMFRDRICKTAEEWRAVDEATKGGDDLDTLRRGSSSVRPN